MLEIRNLHARIASTGTEIIRGLDLTVRAGEVAAIMGPNGSGKSTLSYVLAGRDDYEVTEGDILYDGQSILGLDPAERAAAGVFLAFQYPMEIPGVATMEFLKVALNSQRKARGEEPLKIPEFMKRVKAAADALGITSEGAVRITALRSEPRIDTTESRFPALPAWPSGGTGTREPTR